MTTSHAPGRRRWVVGALVVVAVVVVAGILLRFVLLRDSETPITADEAVQEFRATTVAPSFPPVSTGSPPSTSPTPGTTASGPSPPPEPTTTAPTTSTSTTSAAPSPSATTTPAATTTVPALVAPGVYRYRTTGSEQIDVLGGAVHRYPDETTITVTERGCGVRLRWDALRERRDEWGLCATAAGIELQPDGIQYHEFFGQPDEEALVCDQGALHVPAAATPPDPVQLECMLADDPWFPVWQVLETDQRLVEGVEVPVRHVRMTVTDDDEYWEQNVADWYLAASGLPVEVTVTKASRSPSPVGGVVYEEEYRLELISLEPLR